MNSGMILRDYQQSIFDQIAASSSNDLFQLDTGAGKTPIIAKIAALKSTVIVAHRNFLIEQISETLSKNGINHTVLGNSTIVKRCQLIQRKYDIACGNVYVITIQSLVSKYKFGKLTIDCDSIEQIIIDEAHHVADQNMWASLGRIFKYARFIGCTASPCRLDGQGMHKDCGGLYDNLIQAEQLKENATQWLIAHDYLSDYEYWCPPTEGMDVSKLKIKGKDYTMTSMEQAMKEKDLFAGSVVKSYKKHAHGKRNLVYAISIENAKIFAEEFKKAGYSATYIASSLSLAENIRRIDAFRSGDVTVLINVEMVTEGFDLPEIECVQKARPTASFALDRQMNGRNLRPKPNSNKAIFLDHVGNVFKHGMPDDYIEWSLFGTPLNKTEPMINCENCGFMHNPYLKLCPECGFENWLRNPNAENSPLVVHELVDIYLVKKVRNYFKQLEIDEEKAKTQAEYEIALKTVVQMPKWKYPQNAVGQLCIKLSEWFAENLAKTDLDVSEINNFMLGEKPDLKFWSSNFTIADLNADNPQKCKKVFKKWQSN